MLLPLPLLPRLFAKINWLTNNPYRTDRTDRTDRRDCGNLEIRVNRLSLNHNHCVLSSKCGINVCNRNINCEI